MHSSRNVFSRNVLCVCLPAETCLSVMAVCPVAFSASIWRRWARSSWLPRQPSSLLAPGCFAGVSPGIVKQIIPLLEQLTPIYLDIANGAEVGSLLNSPPICCADV